MNLLIKVQLDIPQPHSCFCIFSGLSCYFGTNSVCFVPFLFLSLFFLHIFEYQVRSTARRAPLWVAVDSSGPSLDSVIALLTLAEPPLCVQGLRRISIQELFLNDFRQRGQILKQFLDCPHQSSNGFFGLCVPFVMLRAMSSAADLPAKFLDLLRECQGLALKL